MENYNNSSGCDDFIPYAGESTVVTALKGIAGAALFTKMGKN